MDPNANDREIRNLFVHDRRLDDTEKVWIGDAFDCLRKRQDSPIRFKIEKLDRQLIKLS